MLLLRPSRSASAASLIKRNNANYVTAQRSSVTQRCRATHHVRNRPGLGLSQLFENNFGNNRCLLEYENYSSLIGFQTSQTSIRSTVLGLVYTSSSSLDAASVENFSSASAQLTVSETIALGSLRLKTIIETSLTLK